MNFHSFSHAEAVEFLNNFLNIERKAVEGMITEARSEGVQADLTVESAREVLKWVVGKLTTVSRLPDESVPSWIRETDSYSSGLFDFDEPSKVVILRAAYYLGQSFVNYSELLSWVLATLGKFGAWRQLSRTCPLLRDLPLTLNWRQSWWSKIYLEEL